MGKISRAYGPTIGGESLLVGSNYTPRSVKRRNIVEKPVRQSRAIVPMTDSHSSAAQETSVTVPIAGGNGLETEQVPLPKRRRSKSK